MKAKLSFLTVSILILITILIAYFLGKHHASTVVDNIALNGVFVKQIAELASLEVHGNVSIKSSNVTDDGSFTESIRKLFMERTINISVPYIAKYGIDLGKRNISIEEKSKQVYIVLPNPKLLSYEVRLDRTNTILKQGLFQSIDDQTYDRIIQKLYSQSKAQLENNEAYKQQSREKIKSIIADYYLPLQYTVEVTFDDELKSKVLDIATPR